MLSLSRLSPHGCYESTRCDIISDEKAADGLFLVYSWGVLGMERLGVRTSPFQQETDSVSVLPYGNSRDPMSDKMRGIISANDSNGAWEGTGKYELS